MPVPGVSVSRAAGAGEWRDGEPGLGAPVQAERGGGRRGSGAGGAAGSGPRCLLPVPPKNPPCTPSAP